MMKQEFMTTLGTDFEVLNSEELQNVEGGIGLVAAGLIVLGVSYGSGLVTGLVGR